MADFLILGASELITLSGGKRFGDFMRDLRIIKDGALAIENGRIAGVGKTQDIEKRFSGEEFDAQKKVVMPGFVDSHTHLIFEGTREDEFELKISGKSYQEILREGGGIYYTVEKTKKASKEKLKKNALKTLSRMLSFGTTTVEAKSGYGLDLEQELKCLKVMKEIEHPLDVIPTYLAHVKPKDFKGDYTSFVVDEILPQIKERKLAEFCDVFCEKEAFSLPESERILKKARKLGFKLKIHADEFSKMGGAELAAKLSCASADHLLKASKKGVERMAERGIVACLLPGTPFVLNSPYPDARFMIQKLPVSLATDFNPSCFTESMQMIITIASLKMGLTPSECISASTINAAFALERKDVGSLEIGKKADVIILDAPNHKHLGYHFGVNLVDSVFKDGKCVVEDGRITF
ncbi:MAG: imidazolonepropionase [Candidatus Methanofastidiosia archaeon]